MCKPPRCSGFPFTLHSPSATETHWDSILRNTLKYSNLRLGFCLKALNKSGSSSGRRQRVFVGGKSIQGLQASALSAAPHPHVSALEKPNLIAQSNATCKMRPELSWSQPVVFACKQQLKTSASRFKRTRLAAWCPMQNVSF